MYYSVYKVATGLLTDFWLDHGRGLGLYLGAGGHGCLGHGLVLGVLLLHHLALLSVPVQLLSLGLMGLLERHFLQGTGLLGPAEG